MLSFWLKWSWSKIAFIAFFLGLGRGDLSRPRYFQGWPGGYRGVTSYAAKTPAHWHPSCHRGQYPPCSSLLGVQAACGEAGKGGPWPGCIHVLGARSRDQAFSICHSHHQWVGTVPPLVKMPCCKRDCQRCAAHLWWFGFMASGKSQHAKSTRACCLDYPLRWLPSTDFPDWWNWQIGKRANTLEFHLHCPDGYPGYWSRSISTMPQWFWAVGREPIAHYDWIPICSQQEAIDAALRDVPGPHPQPGWHQPHWPCQILGSS